jgi:hypothetical protein
MDALAVAASGIVADSLGRSDVQRARAAAKRSATFGMATAAILCIPLLMQPTLVAAIFSDNRCVLYLYCLAQSSRSCVLANNTWITFKGTCVHLLAEKSLASLVHAGDTHHLKGSPDTCFSMSCCSIFTL